VGPPAAIPHPADVPEHTVTGALLPGLVNTHAHLELHALGGPVTHPTFFDWIQHVRRAREACTPEDCLDSARAAVRAGWRYGITTVADTGASGAGLDALTELGGRGVVYQEVFGPDPAQVPQAMANLEHRIEALQSRAGAGVVVGVSPHAPYSVSGSLYRAVRQLATRHQLPVAMHLAESGAESELVVRGRGPFAALWTRRGIPLPRPARTPVEYVHREGGLGPDCLVVHAVTADDRDLDLLRDAGCGLALCPGSNRVHGHGVPPVAAIERRGLPWGLGTDSALSVGDPDLFREARLVRDLAGLAPEEILHHLTAASAEAIGLGGQIGTIEVGKWADLVVVAIPPSMPLSQVPAAVLDAAPGDVLETYLGGRRVHDVHPGVAGSV